MQQQPNIIPRLCAQQADDAGESDLAFFRARPEVHTRIRAAFPDEFNEFPAGLLPDARGRQAVVIVAINRNPVTGEPLDRARGIIFVDGGRA